MGQSSSSPPYIEALTYGEAVQRCEKHGLELCKASCLGTGCFYNMHPVYTSELAVLTMKEATGFYVLCLDTNKEGLEL